MHSGVVLLIIVRTRIGVGDWISEVGCRTSSLRRRCQRTETSGFEKMISMETEIPKNHGRSSTGERGRDPRAEIIEESVSVLAELVTTARRGR